MTRTIVHMVKSLKDNPMHSPKCPFIELESSQPSRISGIPLLPIAWQVLEIPFNMLHPDSLVYWVDPLC